MKQAGLERLDVPWEVDTWTAINEAPVCDLSTLVSRTTPKLLGVACGVWLMANEGHDKQRQPHDKRPK